MYQIISKDFQGYTDNVIYIKRHPENGSYIICSKEEAQGICVKVPKELETEDGLVATLEDLVFSIGEEELGNADKGEIFQVQVALDYFKTKQAEEKMKIQLKEYEQELSILDEVILNMQYNMLLEE